MTILFLVAKTHRRFTLTTIWFCHKATIALVSMCVETSVPFFGCEFDQPILELVGCEFDQPILELKAPSAAALTTANSYATGNPHFS
jgi:hypothetical protein